MRLFQGEGAGAASDERIEMRAVAEGAAEFMGDGPHVSSCRAANVESGAIAFHAFQANFVDGDGYGLEVYRFVLASEFVSGNAVDLLGGDRRRGLENIAAEYAEAGFDVFGGDSGFGNFTDNFTLAVV